MPQSIDYQAVLNDLRERRKRLTAELDAAIAGIERIISGVTPEGLDPIDNSQLERVSQQLETGDLLGLSMPDAVLKYFAMTRKPQSAKAVVEGLKAGGFIVASKSFYANVYTTLLRLMASGKVVRIGREWALSNWRPVKRLRSEDGKGDEENS